MILALSTMLSSHWLRFADIKILAESRLRQLKHIPIHVLGKFSFVSPRQPIHNAMLLLKSLFL